MSTTSAPAWHRSEHLPLRREVMARLREHPILAVNPALQRDAARHGMPSLLQRLEWMLYHAAHSLNEYANVDSLERRVQALVTHYKRRCVDAGSTSEDSEGQSETTGESDADTLRPRSGRTRRLRSVSSEEDALPSGKRQHTLPFSGSDGEANANASITFVVGDSLRHRHGCSLSHNLDLLRHVFSFLDGREVLRCRSVSRFFKLHAPSFACTLHFEGSASGGGPRTGEDARGLTKLLLQCQNLRAVSIGSNANQNNIKAGVVFPRALSQATADTPTSFGHQVALQLAEAVARGGCPKLEALELRAPFDFANESDAALELLQSLVMADSKTHSSTSTSRPNVARRSSLKRIVLDSTFLGDKGMLELTRLIRGSPRCFRRVEHLGLRNNFFGEGGCHSLLEAIKASMPRLRALDLRQNILTDVDAIKIADLLDQPASSSESTEGSCVLSMGRMQVKAAMGLLLAAPRLRSVQLDGNFIGCEGYHAISIALCARREVARLSSCESDSQSEEYDGVDDFMLMLEDDEQDEPMEQEQEQEEEVWA